MKISEDYIIENAYILTEKDKEAILNTQSNPPIKADWNKKNKGITTFKNNLKNYLCEKQHGRCAYCRRKISLDTSFVTIDHIVDKDKYPQWTFLPENLCLACGNCNTFKNNVETLVSPLSTSYPKFGDDFKIINPYHDKYSENIDLLNDILYKAKTQKGIYTIECCHLDRLELAESRAVELITRTNKQTILGDILKLVSNNEELIKTNIEQLKTKFSQDLDEWKKDNE
jgi:uncharacterized protein (TIGR02646 family)